MEIETYRGEMCEAKYFVQCTVKTKARKFFAKEEFGVVNTPLLQSELPTERLKLDVGVEEWLHLKLELKRKNFGLKDKIEGEILFKKVGVKLKTMEVSIIRKETVGTGENQKEHSDTLGTFEVMDDGPIKSDLLKR